MSLAELNNEEPKLLDSIQRIRLADDKCLCHLAYALESDEPIHHKLARETIALMGYNREAISRMGHGWKDVEVYNFAIQRLMRRPKSKEAGQLLYGLAFPTVIDYPEVVTYAKPYLADETPMNIIRRINSPNNRIDMRVCDYAAIVIKYAAIGIAADAAKWGLRKTRLMTRATLDEELPLIKNWVEAHPNWVKERQRELRKQRMAEEKDSKRKLKPGPEPEPEDAP
ncbi:MAG: hypothetical protein HYU36_24985 [Planctomycetes bacterium]|nr:hypothetical protein [Planctomycetota bacterium]